MWFVIKKDTKEFDRPEEGGHLGSCRRVTRDLSAHGSLASSARVAPVSHHISTARWEKFAQTTVARSVFVHQKVILIARFLILPWFVFRNGDLYRVL